MARTARHHAEGAAASSWRRVVACLLGLCLLLSSSHGVHAADVPALDLPVPVLSTGGMAHAGDAASEDGPAQHCADCACHHVADAAAWLSLHVPALAPLRLAGRDAAVPLRPAAPPPRPPRA